MFAGYSLAFSGNGEWFGDMAKAFMVGVNLDSKSGTSPESLFAAFQMTFAIITPALIIGAYVERMKFAALLIFSALRLLVVYAPVTHWVWGGGIRAGWGVLDFAGGIVVHATARTAALVCVLVVDKRRGFPASTQPPDSPVLTMVGACMLWVGWFGFNGGSPLGAGSSAGMVAGLAAVIPASGFIGIPGGLILGVAGGGCICGSWCWRHSRQLVGCMALASNLRWRWSCYWHNVIQSVFGAALVSRHHRSMDGHC